MTKFPKERVPVPAQALALALGAGVRQIPLAGRWARLSGTLAYGRQAIRVASLLWSIGETCVDAGLGVYELWLCSRELRCRRAAVEFL
jgi:hypothetical protein